MNFFITGLVLLISLSCSYANRGFVVEDCAPSYNKIIYIDKLEVRPHPIVMTDSIQVSTRIRITKDLPANSYIEVSDMKYTSFLGIPVNVPIPCLQGNIGSCNHRACTYLDMHKERICRFLPPGVDCVCPLKAGIYEGQNVVVPMPNLGSLVRWFAQGKYKIEIKLVDGRTRKNLGCLRIFTELTPGRY